MSLNGAGEGNSDAGQRNSIVGGFLVLLARGVLLWLVVPLAALVWVFLVIRLHRRGVTFGQFLGWIDLNLMTFLQRVIFRPLVRLPASWVPPRALPSVTHRLRVTDPV